MGPIAIPLMLGLLPWFRKFGPSAAIASVIGGLGVWAFLYIEQLNKAEFVTKGVLVATPLIVSLILYVGFGLLKPEGSPDRDKLLQSLDSDDDSKPADEEPVPVKA
jgi:hypothetical protein